MNDPSYIRPKTEQERVRDLLLEVALIVHSHAADGYADLDGTEPEYDPRVISAKATEQVVFAIVRDVQRICEREGVVR